MKILRVVAYILCSPLIGILVLLAISITVVDFALTGKWKFTYWLSIMGLREEGNE